MSVQLKTAQTLSNILSVMSEYDQRLTIRQIYYRLVADYGLENSMNSYKRIVSILSKARLSGTIPYGAIEDRTREITEFDKYGYSPVGDFMETWYDRLETLDDYYWVSKWKGQPERVVVMVEKQALQGIFSDVCKEWEVDLMVCKGYLSLTQQYELVNRLRDRIDEDQDLHMIYFGDFDPSGENIPEKMEERLDVDFDLQYRSFTKEALTIEQVEEWGIPPAPAKGSDSRTRGFMRKYGVGMQVELDAIKPDQLTTMINEAIARHYDEDIGKERDNIIRDGRNEIRRIIERMDIDGLRTAGVDE